ncbi:MAG: histidine kinase [Verrucomicrobia bacterium]|nr:histidine kinase [Verrucomicrobiota bacterium]
MHSDPAQHRPAPTVVSGLRAAVRLLALVCGFGAACGSELGRPAFRDFPPGRSQIGFLIQSVTQDETGFVYLADNYVAFRYYDGAVWRPIPGPAESAGVRKFARTADGTIYAGGPGVIGYLRGAGGMCEFVSLAGRLPPTELGCDEINDVLAAGQTVYFADEEKILRWRDGGFRVIPFQSPPRSRGPRLHRVGESVFVAVPGRPLCRLVEERLEEVADDPVVRAEAIVMIEPGPAGGLVLLTAGRGFFQIAGGRVVPLAAEANRWLAGRTIWRALRLTDGSLGVIFTSVSGDGGMRFGPDGRYVGPLDQTLGLYTKAFRGLFQDREGGLWLPSEVGAFRLEWPSALSVFDAVNGLGAGAVAGVVRHDGVLYAATEEGVFRLVPAGDDGRGARFERVLKQPASALLSHPAGLIALGYAELLAQTATGFAAVAATPPGGGALLRSEREPDCVWVGTGRGLQAVRHTPQGWRDEGLQMSFGETAQAVRPAADDSLWVSTTGAQGFRVRFSPATGRPERLVSSPGEYAASEILAECAATMPNATGGSGARWVARPTGIELVPQGGGEFRRLPQLANASAGAVGCLREERGPDGPVLWIGGARGLLRVEVARAFAKPVPFAAVLTAAGVRESERLAPAHAPVRFDYVALRHQLADSVSYQTRLAGLEEGWSAWTAERTRAFVRLPAGAYRFEVRARDADGTLSAPAALGFSVMPPWWLTGWAILGYAAGGAGLLAALVRIRTRALRLRAERLEGMVVQRTGELAQRNLELVRLHKLELDEKISARLGEEKARLEVLRYQLNPHFLFNTLASISAALPAGGSTARTMVERLAEFCRLTLHRADERDGTTLGEEMRLLRAYLEIEKSRWGELLEVEIACDPAIEGERLPHFLLLPLVENALKYGRATSPDRVGLRLALRRNRDGALVIEVANTGEWLEPAAGKNVASLGIGLDNLRERLNRYYPRLHELAIAHRDGWVMVTLRILPPPVL